MPLINNINNLLRLVGFSSFCLICFIKCRQFDAICSVQWFCLYHLYSLLQIAGFSGFVCATYKDRQFQADHLNWVIINHLKREINQLKKKKKRKCVGVLKYLSFYHYRMFGGALCI